MRLELCRLSEKHLEMIRGWRNSPEVSNYMYTDHYISEEEHKKWYEKIKDDSSKKYWLIKFDGRYVGVVNLYNIDMVNKRCSWAYYLGEPSARGRGIGKQVELNILKYVLEDLKLNKLCCEVLASNDLVVKIHMKYGSKIEGVLRKHIYNKGEFRDVVVMGILREEFAKIKGEFDFVRAKIE